MAIEQIPAHIKEQMSRDFLVEFNNNILASFEDGYVPVFDDYNHMEGTNRWYSVFTKTCTTLSLNEVMNYRNQLDWEDCDTFDFLLSHMLLENGIVKEN